ncbi:MAG: hypothetical protein LAO21_03220 [Acidobacteriia bacterium]|nr:hypothetical protein [Terriglobia bacterium]
MKNMTYKLVVLALVSFLPIAATEQLRLYAQPDKRDETRLQRHVRLAKEKGATSVEMTSPLPNYAEVDSLDQAMWSSAVLVVKLQDQTSVPSSSEDAIWTWYKLKVLRDLSDTPLPKETALPPNVPLEIPASILPLKGDEVLIRDTGGTVTVDGVEVRGKPLYEGFRKDGVYLLFADLTGFSNSETLTRFGRPAFGPYGIFKVDAGGQIQPLSKDFNDFPLTRALRERFANSLERFSLFFQRY